MMAGEGPMMAVLLMTAGDDVGIDRERIAKYNRLLQIEEWLAEHGMLATTA
jgi:enolase